jgi:hypothetical protein
MKLVKIAYDTDTRSAQATKELLEVYPNLKGIISPTTVGIAAAVRVLQQAGRCGKVALTVLGLPSQMRTYQAGVCEEGRGLGRVELRLRRDVRGPCGSRGQADRQEGRDVQGREVWRR